MLAHKTSLSEFKKIDIISSVFSDHYFRRLEIIRKKKKKYYPKHKHMEPKQNATKHPMGNWRNQRGN